MADPSGGLRRAAASVRGAARAAVLGWAAEGADWLFPPRCLACEEEAEAAGGLCGACWRGAEFLGDAVCPRCGSPEGGGLGDPAARALARLGPATQLCRDCPDGPSAWTRARAAARYDGAARDLVLALKEGDRLDVAQWMGRRMAETARRSGLIGASGEPPTLVPVPLHWLRRLRRRFNQSAALARVVARETGCPLAIGAVRRVRATPRQARLDRARRTENLAGAFALGAGARAVEGRAVVLIDDVMTTGATLDAVGRVLLSAGATRVDALLFARAAALGRTSDRGSDRAPITAARAGD